MRQPTAPSQPGPYAPFSRTLPIPGEPARFEDAPPLRTHFSDGAAPPPVPARPPPPPGNIQRPATVQGFSHSHPDPSTFPVVPPPPPLPRRVQSNDPNQVLFSKPGPSHMSSNSHLHHSWHDHAREEQERKELENRLRMEREEQEWREREQERLRLEREEQERREVENRLRLEREEIARQALALERLRLEEERKRLDLEREVRERKEALEREVEEEKRRKEQEMREQWEREQRIREAEWEAKQRQREEELERMRIEALEQKHRLEREMEDARIAVEISIQEEIEAKKQKFEAAERARVAEIAAQETIAQLAQREKEEREAMRLQEEKDAEMARRWESESQVATSSTNAVESHGGTNAIPKNPATDLPEYDDNVHQGQRPQPQHQHQHQHQPQLPQHQHQHQSSPVLLQQQMHNVPASPIHPPGSSIEQGFGTPLLHTTNSNPLPVQRPHSNTMHALSPPLAHSMSHPQPLNAPPMIPNPNHFLGPTLSQPLAHSPNRHSMLLPEMSIPNQPMPNQAMSNQPGPNQHLIHSPNHPTGGSGPGPSYRNHFFPPQQEAEAGSSSQPTVSAGRPPPRQGKLVRPSSLGGGNPNRLSKAPNHGMHFQGPGHVTNSASMSSFPPSANVGNARPPPNQAGMSQPSSSSVNSSPGAGSSSQPLASTSSSTPPPLSIVTPPGISFPNTDSLSGILHGYGRPIIREQPLPTATSVQEVVVMEPEPSPPFFIVAQTWKNLIKFIASQSNTRVEPSPAALAREKHGPPNLRVVLHFVKLPNGDHRIIMYLAVQSIVPPPENYPVTDTSVVPYLFPAPEPGRPLENLPETQIYSIPTKPLPILPVSLPHLAPYLQAALDESTRSRDSRSRLQKLVQATTVTTHSTSHIATALITGSSGSRYESEGNPIKVAESSGSRRNFIARVFRPKSSGNPGNKSVNNENYDVVTPFTMDNYA
ncbi:hypothetical protein FRC17_001996 [Serendipita sp. 399]|nr:hypothetical protein FRC17_001996 [Serendipita sp. 399]